MIWLPYALTNTGLEKFVRYDWDQTNEDLADNVRAMYSPIQHRGLLRLSDWSYFITVGQTVIVDLDTSPITLNRENHVTIKLQGEFYFTENIRDGGSLLSPYGSQLMRHTGYLRFSSLVSYGKASCDAYSSDVIVFAGTWRAWDKNSIYRGVELLPAGTTGAFIVTDEYWYGPPNPHIVPHPSFPGTVTTVRWPKLSFGADGYVYGSWDYDPYYGEAAEMMTPVGTHRVLRWP